MIKEIEFTVGGETLRGRLFTPEVMEPLHPAVLCIHGWQSKQGRGSILVETLANRGFVCMTFDLRGHGASGGDITTLSRKDFLDDVLAAYDVLAATPGVDRGRITVVGSSFGAYLAAIVSSKRNVASLVLRVPANYRDEDFEGPQYTTRTSAGHAEWKLQVQDSAATVALRAVHAFPGKVLLVESENDEQVPAPVVHSYAKAVLSSSNLTHVVMKGAPHSLSQDEPRQKEYADIVLSWITK